MDHCKDRAEVAVCILLDILLRPNKNAVCSVAFGDVVWMLGNELVQDTNQTLHLLLHEIWIRHKKESKEVGK
jgi:hypothetical protein